MARQNAKYWQPLTEGVQCLLCPHQCKIAEGQTGRCRVRQNQSGELVSLNYAEVSSIGLDPIEKKPLFHFYPGEMILSVGTWGCNLNCEYCQNWEIVHGYPPVVYTKPAELAELAIRQGPVNIGVAYTYSEPAVWFEYVLDAANEVKKNGMKNVMVTNGFINPDPLEDILPLIDAMNIDIKAFRPEFYRTVCSGELDPVKRNVARAAATCHVEVTTLLIPGLNDGVEEITELAQWLAGIDSEIPLHLSRYFPRYRMEIPPTPIESLIRAKQTAEKYLQNVYLGNLGAR